MKDNPEKIVYTPREIEEFENWKKSLTKFPFHKELREKLIKFIEGVEVLAIKKTIDRIEVYVDTIPYPRSKIYNQLEEMRDELLGLNN